jgi:hypothetical protein
MSHMERILIYKPLPLTTPGVRSAVANLRKRGYGIVYFVRLCNAQFQYLVKAERRT